jgi:hypothetical protein
MNKKTITFSKLRMLGGYLKYSYRLSYLNFNKKLS